MSSTHQKVGLASKSHYNFEVSIRLYAGFQDNRYPEAQGKHAGSWHNY